MRSSRSAARLARVALPVFATAAVALVLAPPAAQAHTPAAPPTTVARNALAAAAPKAPTKPAPVLPIDLNLGIVHLKVVVPLTLGGLLGGTKASTPVTTPTPPGPSDPAVPSTGPQASDATPVPAPHATPTIERKPAHHPAAAATSAPARAAGSAQAGGSEQADGPAPADTTPQHLRTSGAAKAIHHPQAAPNLLQRAFEPSTPVLILAAIAVVCGLGVTSVVLLGGRRSRRAR